MDTRPAGGLDMEFVEGGFAHRLMRRIGIMRGDDLSVGRRTLFFAAVTWVPLLVFSVIDGRAAGPTPRDAFLTDFTVYARFLVALPLLFVAEAVVGPRFRLAAQQFVRGGLVRPEELPAMEAAVRRNRSMREALLPELVMLALALFGGWFLTAETWHENAGTAWNTVTMDGGTRLSLAGVWYRCIAVPVFQFSLLWWLWRLILWIAYLYEVSRLRLHLMATHADRAGGLGLLGNAHTSLGMLALALSCVVSSGIAVQVRYHAVPIETFATLAITYLVIATIVCFGPLGLFMPLLVRTRYEGLGKYGILVNTYSRLFNSKWVDAAQPSPEPLLGTPDIQSLADIGNSFSVIEGMRTLPCSMRQVGQFVVMACLPGLPLILLVVPLARILKFLGSALL